MKKLINIIMISVLISGASKANNNKFYPSRLTDNSGLVYIGYEINHDQVTTYLKDMQELLGEKKFKVFRENQIKRDHGSFHITLINPFEYSDVKNIDVSKLPSASFSFKGLGHGRKLEDNTYFIVVSSNEAQKVRQIFSLKEKDFHITLGFDKKDVFGIDKSIKSLVQPLRSESLRP